MKIIFLDFDGVLNSLDHKNDPIPDWVKADGEDWPFLWIRQAAAQLLKPLLSDDVHIVVCSTWRRHWSMTDLERILGLPVLDKTPGSDNIPRWQEIESWILNWETETGEKVAEWVWVDDYTRGMPTHIAEHTVTISLQTGLTSDHITTIRKILNETPSTPTIQTSEI